MSQIREQQLPWRYSNGAHRLALVTACATGLLLLVGGLVTSKGVGLAVPDWPTTFGHNMFLYPWSKMVGGVFYEHSHRLVASGVGFLTLLLAVVLWLKESRRWVRWLGTVALVLVIIQGVLGGMRVVLLDQGFALFHGTLAQIFFALVVSMALFTSRGWGEGSETIRLPEAKRIRRLSLMTTGFIFLQGILGALLRFTGLYLEFHVLGALLVAIHVLLVSMRLQSVEARHAKLAGPAMSLAFLLILQLALGLGSFVGEFAPLGIALTPGAVVALTTFHMFVGALMLATSLVLTLRCYRHLALPEPHSRKTILAARMEGGSEQVSV